MENKLLILSFQRALLGQLSNHIRAITTDYNENTLKSVFYFDREPTDFDVDLAEMITAEVIADFPEISNEKLTTVYSDEPINKLENLNLWILLKKEDEVW